MPVVVGEGSGQYNTVNHVLNGEPAAQVVFRRPSINLSNRTDSLKTFANALETRYIGHAHTGDGVSEPGQIARAGISGVNAPNGMCGLDGNAQVPIAQLPGAVLGGLQFQSAWDADTNSPAITSGTATTTPSPGNNGHYYIVSVAGSTNVDGITDWKVGDWIVSDGVSWVKIDNTTEPRLQQIIDLGLSGMAGWAIGVDSLGTNLVLLDLPTRNAAVDAELSLHASEIATLDGQVTAIQSTLNVILTNVSVEQSLTVTNPAGQTIFTLTDFTLDPSNAVVDCQVYVNNSKVIQDQTGAGVKDFIKISSTQLQFAETQPKDAVVTVFKQGTSTGGGVGDYTNIPVAPQPMGDLDLGSLAKPWQSLYMKDMTSNQVYRIAITGGEFAATLVP